MAQAPMCKLCGSAHWSGQWHKGQVDANPGDIATVSVTRVTSSAIKAPGPCAQCEVLLRRVGELEVEIGVLRESARCHIKEPANTVTLDVNTVTPSISVTAKRGRPALGVAKTSAERQRASRAKRRAKK